MGSSLGSDSLSTGWYDRRLRSSDAPVARAALRPLAIGAPADRGRSGKREMALEVASRQLVRVKSIHYWARIHADVRNGY